MFSPLNVIIKPSRIKRGLFLSIHALALLSLSLSLAPAALKYPLVVLVLASAVVYWRSMEPSWVLHWDLNAGLISVAKNSEPLEECIAIEQLYLVFGVLYIQLKRVDKVSVHLLIFPDSVNAESYRRLRVAARWASIVIKSE
ncbi:MAG: hypothetical protein HRU06_11180 [Oceanospirillaceae bacterium]|nr:hypothetical protein [Oceanospirillaceae bacterium]